MTQEPILQSRWVSQSPNTCEPKKKFLLRAHGTLPSGEPPSRLPWSFSFPFHVPFLWRFLGLSLFFFFTSPSCGDSLVFLFSFFSATDQPWRTQRLPWLLVLPALVCSSSVKKSFVFLSWATRRTKNSTANLVGCSSVLKFLLFLR